ncbi:MAG: site-specific integrase [Lachnospiraceae bacterium]|nr:site-specific integrase [Lachnospiraceae bacterium]
MRTFVELKDAKQWLNDTRHDDAHGSVIVSEGMTVNEWYEQWQEQRSKIVRPNTIRNYRERYQSDIKPVIGRMRMTDVMPIHCQKVLNDMASEGYSEGTIKQTLQTMITMFYAAYENNVIRKSPVTKSGVKMPPAHKKKPIDFFTIEEEKRFIEVAKDYAYYEQFRLILETGLRTGEVIGLEWKHVDLENRVIRVEKTLEFRYDAQKWLFGIPKTEHGIRDVPLSQTAYEILKGIKDRGGYANENTPDEFRDLVFLNRTGFPTKNSTYDAALQKRCEQAGVKRLSMHDLRHTMATRFCENSTNYKFLSRMLGHSSIKITVDTYVHETSQSKAQEAQRFSDYMEGLFS